MHIFLAMHALTHMKRIFVYWNVFVVGCHDQLPTPFQLSQKRMGGMIKKKY